MKSELCVCVGGWWGWGGWQPVRKEVIQSDILELCSTIHGCSWCCNQCYGKVNRSVLEIMLFYKVVRNMHKIKCDCDFKDGEVEEQNLPQGVWRNQWLSQLEKQKFRITCYQYWGDEDITVPNHLISQMRKGGQVVS